MLYLLLSAFAASAAKNLALHNDITKVVESWSESHLRQPMRDLKGVQMLQKSGLLFGSESEDWKIDLPDATNLITKLINKLLKGRNVTVPDQTFSQDGFEGSAKNITCGSASVEEVQLHLTRGEPYYTFKLSVTGLKAECDFIIAAKEDSWPHLTLPASASTAKSLDSNLTIGMVMGKDKYRLPINATGTCDAGIHLDLWIDAPTGERGLINLLIAALEPTIDSTLKTGICDGMGDFPGVVKLIDDDLSPWLYNASNWVETHMPEIIQELKDVLEEVIKAIEEIIDNIDEIIKRLEKVVIQRLEHWIEDNTNNGTANTQGADDFPASVKVALIVFFAFVFGAFLFAGCRHHRKAKASAARHGDSLLANQ